MISWHVSRHGKIRGPFSESEMFELIGKRKVARGDFVDANQSGNWWPIESVPTFAASFPVPMPVVPLFAPPPVAPSYLPDSVCVHCGSQGRKIRRSRVTGSGWAVFFVCLLLCFPISLVAVVAMREHFNVCQNCGAHS